MLRLFQRQAPESAAHFDIAHDGEIYRVALKRVADVASLHAQGSNGDPRCVADDALALLAQGGARIRRTPRRMDRHAACAAAANRSPSSRAR